ncbi:hypothetical protein NQZ68_015172 [Dissostichus eleginoides]|nr:hypothetical protein NQZ68_015172 [Dissostichus eleginoides]
MATDKAVLAVGSPPAAVVLDSDVTAFDWVSSGLTWTPTLAPPPCGPVSPRFRASPLWWQQDALTPRNYQGRVPAIRSHITRHPCAR